MIVLQASHITKQFDGMEILKDASLTVQSRDRVALIGANGAGKSTLLRIIVGELAQDSGDVSMAKDVTMGYVSQFVDVIDEVTVYEHVSQMFDHVRKMEHKLRSLEQQMAKPEVYEHETKFQEVTNAYSALQHEFEEIGGYAIEARIRRVLDGLNFPKEMHNLSVQSLSGGQKTRLSLARLLAWQPNLLVLDEPTNYLDTDTLTWLEGYLQSYEGALLIVSHDRYFLDQVATHIVELDDGRTTRYVGNYSAYVDEKAARLEADEKRYEAQQKEIGRTLDFIQKNISRASTTKRAQSRRKMLERMTRLDKPSAHVPQMALSFHAKRASGKDVLRVTDLSIGYPDKVISRNLDLYISRGQRVAIVGPNGIGKTTFLKTLTDSQKPLAGQIQWGQHVHLGYYDQEQEDLAAGKTVLDQVWDEHPSLDTTTIRTALGRFLFRGEDVNKPVQTLSGGERSRLNLCRLMLEEANTLLLDEPTNHLDLMSKEVLEDALSDYEGTLLFVSHDRYFIDAIATHVAVLTSSGFQVYIGNYTDYRRKQAEDEKWSYEEEHPSDGSAASTSALADVTATATHGAAAETQNFGGGQRQRVRSSDVRKAKERVDKLEELVAQNEARQTEIALELNDAAINQDVERTKDLQAELESCQEEQLRLFEEWEQATARLEELTQES